MAVLARRRRLDRPWSCHHGQGAGAGRVGRMRADESQNWEAESALPSGSSFQVGGLPPQKDRGRWVNRHKQFLPCRYASGVPGMETPGFRYGVGRMDAVAGLSLHGGGMRTRGSIAGRMPEITKAAIEGVRCQWKGD
jgi:hypothetical protein